MGYIAPEKEINLLHPESQRMYRRLVEELRMGVYMADSQGNLFYVNDAFVWIFGYQNREEMLGLNWINELFLNPEEKELFLKSLEKLGFVRDYVVKNKRKDGSIVALSVTSHYIRNNKEEVIGLEGVVEDITEKEFLARESRILTKAVEQTADHIMITDRWGTILYVNPAFEKTTGYEAREILGRTPKILKSGRHGKDYYEELWSTILAGKIFHAQTTNKNKKGELYVADQTVSPIKNPNGEVTHFVSVWKDITERVRLEEQLKDEKHKLEEIVGFDEKVSSMRKLDRLFDFVVDKTTEILNAGKCSVMLIDHRQGELCIKGAKGFEENIFEHTVKIGESISGLVAQEGKPLLVKDIQQEPRFRHRARSSYAGPSFMSVPIKRDEETIGVINVAEKGKTKDESFDEIDLKILCSISREVLVAIENLKMYKELLFLTITDSLTGLHNFRHFSKTLDYELKRTKRLSRPLGLMMIDMDHFKSYNDDYGHLEGNRLLKGIGEILQKNVREIDILCRYGGDEFAVILPDTGKEEAQAVAERSRIAVLEANFRRPVTISIGIGVYVQNMGRYELTSRADGALYEAKKTGRNRVCLYG